MDHYRAGRVDAGRGSKSEQVQRAVLRQIGPFGISDLEKECPGVSRETIRNVLRGLKKGGVVRVEGRGPGARWHRAGQDR